MIFYEICNYFESLGIVITFAVSFWIGLVSFARVAKTENEMVFFFSLHIL